MNMDDQKSDAPSREDYHEGPAAANAFQQLLKKALNTPPAEIKKRDKQWREGRKKKSRS